MQINPNVFAANPIRFENIKEGETFISNGSVYMKIGVFNNPRENFNDVVNAVYLRTTGSDCFPPNGFCTFFLSSDVCEVIDVELVRINL